MSSSSMTSSTSFPRFPATLSSRRPPSTPLIAPPAFIRVVLATDILDRDDPDNVILEHDVPDNHRDVSKHSDVVTRNVVVDISVAIVVVVGTIVVGIVVDNVQVSSLRS